MTNEEINEIIAQKVWGWLSNQKAYFNEQNQYIVSKHRYSPSTNFLQAFEALEKFCKDRHETGLGRSLNYCNNRYECIIFKFVIHHIIAVAMDTTETTAICNALIQALVAK
jgi:hypothetical protein